MFSTCRRPGCEAGICEETFDLVECGAGLRLKAECNIGHKNSFSTCEFFNKKRTSVLDIKISAISWLSDSVWHRNANKTFYIDMDFDSTNFFQPLVIKTLDPQLEQFIKIKIFWWVFNEFFTKLNISVALQRVYVNTLSTLTGRGYSRRSSELFKLRVSPFV